MGELLARASSARRLLGTYDEPQLLLPRRRCRSRWTSSRSPQPTRRLHALLTSWKAWQESLLAAAFPKRVAGTNVYASSGPEVGQSKVHPPVVAKRRSEQREEGLVLVDREELAIARRPPLRREVERHDA